MKNILIIEDERTVAELERDYLEINSLKVSIEETGDGGLKRILKNDIDLVILDLMLPDMDGFEVCRKIRRRTDIPILIVSAKKSDIDKIRGLGIGADDYIVKPFILPNLLARIEAVLRRCQWQKEAAPKQEAGLNKNVNIDALTPKEKEVLALVAKGASNQEIADQLYVRDVTVKTHLNSIFKKLKVTNRTQAVLLAMQMNLIS